MNQSNPLHELVSDIIDNIGIDLPDPTLPTPTMINYYVFERDRKLFLEEDIDRNVMDILKLIIRWNMEDKNIPPEERKPITLYIMSEGGLLIYMWALIATMLASRTPIITVNLGVAGSASALIYLAGQKRYMLKTAITVIHQGSAEMTGDANKIIDAVDNYKTDLDKMRNYILSRTTIPVKLFNKKNKDDWYMNADVCLEYGVCHKIVETIDEII